MADDWQDEGAAGNREKVLAGDLEAMDLLGVAEAVERAVDSLSTCGTMMSGLSSYLCGIHGLWRYTLRCKHRLCQVCASTRQGRLLNRYGEHVTAYRTKAGAARSVMVTSTQKTERGEGVAAGVGRLRTRTRRMARLIRADFDERDDAGRVLEKRVGGLSNVEAVPRGDQTWHVHEHLLLALPDELPEEWTLPDARPDWQPVNPWRLRYLWAIANLDRRTRVGRAAADHLLGLADEGRDLWARKMTAPRGPRREAAADRETELLSGRWAESCAYYGVPSVVDVRSKHPSEAIKYVSKGFDIDRDGMTSWHLLDLLTGTAGMRRAVAWGTLHALGDPDEDEPDEHQEQRPCPSCGEPSWCVAGDELDDLVRGGLPPPLRDWVLACTPAG